MHETYKGNIISCKKYLQCKSKVESYDNSSNCNLYWLKKYKQLLPKIHLHLLVTPHEQIVDNKIWNQNTAKA